ncbi:MAG: DegT/DnrJ/EryC1/StrS family aminotransferase [Deltaproteobacteria bacterium]|nr:DegT/DnrJ/EryC1/StrS family aminotransferase [Deltaproteobacteria bacterium]
MPGHEIIGEEERREILDVLSRKVLFRYEFDAQREGVYKVETFEKEFARYCGVRHALAVSSGTAALHVALAALGVGPGDEVITQGFTFVATWEAILEAGAVPVFAEIDETLCLDPDDLEARITPRTRAVIPVHMCGAQARVEEIVSAAGRHGVPVIEDTAQSCGGRFGQRALGSFGALGTFSFDSVKTVTTGEGGMVITDDEELYLRASEYHDHGHDHDPSVGRGLEKRRFIGFNYRMMELQGALGLAQLRKLDPVILPGQRENKRILKEALEKHDGITFRDLPDPAGDSATFLIFFLPTAEQAQAFNRVLADQGAGAVYWHDNLWHYYEQWEHLLEARTPLAGGWPFRSPDGTPRCGYEPAALPRTAEILSRALTIPIRIRMDEQLPVLIEAINKAAGAAL